ERRAEERTVEIVAYPEAAQAFQKEESGPVGKAELPAYCRVARAAPVAASRIASAAVIARADPELRARVAQHPLNRADSGDLWRYPWNFRLRRCPGRFSDRGTERAGTTIPAFHAILGFGPARRSADALSPASFSYRCR